ncbi:aldo/keto reductase [Sphingobacterium hungaricum]|uniref:Oxidoreductase n=1 Tax=Sphingobacterium hungaricum TaxID=2082723 RepID=A0A928YQQ2_9SPHI|nr:aldo/keto reductase [Sphingobacterium hungaricum]MBE8714491.1 oxidoreductase [Sphingobacterium hungaricum]
MNQNKLGNSDLKVSAIGFGGMSLKPANKSENQRILSEALDVGINYFDTADLYDQGENEVLLGEALKSYRNAVCIATKVGNKWREDGSTWDWKASKSYILQAVEDSLKRLNTDYIDLYQLHGGTIEDPIDEIIEAFETLKSQGKIREYGISSIRPNVIKEYLSKSKLTSIMMQYSLLDRRPEEYFELIDQHHVSVISRGAVAQGLLIDKPAKTYLSYVENEVKQAQKIVHDFAKQQEVSAQSVSLAYVLAHSTVASAVVGIRTTEQMKDLSKTIQELDNLSAHELLELSSAFKTIQYADHR